MDTAELPKMAPPPPPPPPPLLNWKATIDELTKGRDLVSQLGATFPTGTARDHLAREISDSFSRALVALKSEEASEEKLKKFDTKKRMIDSGQKRQRIKRTHPGSSNRITTAILGDGYLWRKYGQKTIHNFKFPRCYLRCTNKYGQNCPAMKQVQQSEEDPSLYVVTYIGDHTCQGSAAPLVTSPLEKGGACIINFGSGEEPANFPSPPLLATRLQEHSSPEGISSTLTHHASSSSEYMPELEKTEGSTHFIMGGWPELAGDATSCLQPSKDDDHDHDLVWDYLDLSEVFSFNLGEEICNVLY